MNNAIGIFFVVWLTVVWATSPTKEECNPNRCGGPRKFYREIGCKAVFKPGNTCCPERYDCDHMKARSSDKCYAFGKEYNSGEEVKSESRGIGCFAPCTCIKGPDDKVGFNCAEVSPPLPPNPECYRPRNATECHPGPEICFDTPEEVPTCQVDGWPLKAGNFFVPRDDVRKACWCGPGYTGENTEPFCKSTMDEFCGAELYYKREVEQGCAPLFHGGKDPAHDCNHQWRCPDEAAELLTRESIHSAFKPVDDSDDRPEMLCKFGTRSPRRGDVIRQLTDGDKCLLCLCEMPPVMTCFVGPKVACTRSAEEISESVR